MDAPVAWLAIYMSFCPSFKTISLLLFGAGFGRNEYARVNGGNLRMIHTSCHWNCTISVVDCSWNMAKKPQMRIKQIPPVNPCRFSKWLDLMMGTWDACKWAIQRKHKNKYESLPLDATDNAILCSPVVRVEFFSLVWSRENRSASRHAG